MPSPSDWKVPSAVVPKPEDYGYDLDRALASLVGITSVVPADAFSAETLGTERAGNGVLIREDGTVLTIGYLITEAEQVWLTFSDGRSAPGHVLGYDQETGFGLVQALARVDLPDRESEPLALAPESFDLAVCGLAFQFVNDLPGVLAQIRRALKPDGLLLAAMIGGDTLTELRQAFAAAEAELEGGVSPRVAPFADLRDIGALLQRVGFALPVTDVDRVVVRYASAFALMQDLRSMGATNVLVERRRTPTRRATMLRMAQLYAERFADPDGRIRATFDVIWLSGWAPHESQQQPLKPGSAKASLAEAVKGKTK